MQGQPSNKQRRRKKQTRPLLKARSTICTLPFDVLSEIFKTLWAESYEFDDEPVPPTRLGAVCSFWRHVAWSTPQLWTVLHLRNRFWWFKDRAYILDLYFKNIGSLTLALSIRDYPSDIDIGKRGKKRRGKKRSKAINPLHGHDETHNRLSLTPFPAQDIFRIIFIHHPDKLKSVMMEHYVYSWLQQIGNISESAGFPNLQAFGILSSEGGNPGFASGFNRSYRHPPVTILNTPALHHVILTGPSDRFYFPWTQLLSLDLCGVNANYAMQIVLECINLQGLRVLQLDDTIQDDVGSPRERLILGSLEVFEYSDYTVPLSWTTGLVEYLSFSSLKVLSLDVHPYEFNRHVEFLRNLPSTIIDLSLICTDTRPFKDSLFGLLARLNSLDTLSLTFCDPLPIEILKSLTAKPRQQNILPVLAQLRLVLVYSANPLGKKKLRALVELLRSRFGNRCPEGVEEIRRFCLSLRSSNLNIKSSQNIKTEFERLRRNGLDVEVDILEGVGFESDEPFFPQHEFVQVESDNEPVFLQHEFMQAYDHIDPDRWEDLYPSYFD